MLLSITIFWSVSKGPSCTVVSGQQNFFRGCLSMIAQVDTERNYNGSMAQSQKSYQKSQIERYIVVSRSLGHSMGRKSDSPLKWMRNKLWMVIFSLYPNLLNPLNSCQTPLSTKCLRMERTHTYKSLFSCFSPSLSTLAPSTMHGTRQMSKKLLKNLTGDVGQLQRWTALLFRSILAEMIEREQGALLYHFDSFWAAVIPPSMYDENA